MFILQNLRDFIDNPMGRGSNAITSRQLIVNDYKARLAKMLETKKIPVTIYKSGVNYIFHLLIPSEGPHYENTYDVVLQFSPVDEDSTRRRTLDGYNVKFFSNSPSFTYTFAYSFNLHGLLIEFLEDRYRDETFNKMPVTRNPGDMISYEKSITLAALYILSNDKYYMKSSVDLVAKPINQDAFERKIRTSDKILLEIKKEKNRVEKEKQEEQAKVNKYMKSKTRNAIPSREKTVGRKGSPSKDSDIPKFKDKGKITPRKSSIKKIKPKK